MKRIYVITITTKKYLEYLRVVANSHSITFKALKTVKGRISEDFEAFSFLSATVILRN